MLEILAVVVNMNVWTRIKLAEGAMPGPPPFTAHRVSLAGEPPRGGPDVFRPRGRRFARAGGGQR
jgi:hypothetical protein